MAEVLLAGLTVAVTQKALMAVGASEGLREEIKEEVWGEVMEEDTGKLKE